MRIEETAGAVVDRKTLLGLLEQIVEREFRCETMALTERQEGESDENAEHMAGGAVSASESGR